MRKLMFLSVLFMLGFFSWFCYTNIDTKRRLADWNSSIQMEKDIKILQFSLSAALPNVPDKVTFASAVVQKFPDVDPSKIYQMLHVEIQAEQIKDSNNPQ